MVEIVPAVLADSPDDYRRDLEVATSLTDRVQIDLVDGEFASNRTVGLAQAYWPQGTRADLHMMFNHPQRHLETLISLSPHLVIVHAEAEGVDEMVINSIRTDLQKLSIKFGLAILPETTVADVEPYLGTIDHLLVFTGELGHYGGQLQTECLSKVEQAKRLNPRLEVGIDGGVTDATVRLAAGSGADVLNVGGFIQGSDDPQAAYATLKLTANQTI